MAAPPLKPALTSADVAALLALLDPDAAYQEHPPPAHFLGYSRKCAAMSSCTARCKSIPTARYARITSSVHTPVSAGTSPPGYGIRT